LIVWNDGREITAVAIVLRWIENGMRKQRGCIDLLDLVTLFWLI
jgi:hypothetical protein